jgi:hypothetical protein
MRHLALALALVAGLLAAPAAPATAHCSDTIIPLYTLHMEWEPERKRYRIGQTARIHVNVTRPGEEDPLGEGIPWQRPFSEPAEDVSVGVGGVIDDVLAHGTGRTDENGDAVVRIRIPEWASPGWAHARGLGQHLVAEVAGCFWIIEYAFKRQSRFFRVVR